MAIQSVLRPTDYYALIGTLKVMAPLVAQIVNDFGDRIFDSRKFNATSTKRIQGQVAKYEQAISALIAKLEADYLTSKQIEMLLLPCDGKGRPVGIVDLDLGDYEPAELRSRLGEGRYVVVGKIVRRVGTGEKLDLMQKTVIATALEIMQRLTSSQQKLGLSASFKDQVALVREQLRPFVMLEVPGPAVRVAAMSVCI